MTVTYPSPEDYIRAVQDPGAVFHDAALRRARFAVDPILQVPMPASGSAAVVFRAEVDGRDRALRFFTHAAAERARYLALEPVLTTADLRGCVAEGRWCDDAVLVGGRRWPMVDMEWVDGRTLDAYVAHLAGAGDARSLTALAVEWRSLIGTLQRARFAHGDLQHGNVLVDTAGTLRLVDLDGSWATGAVGQVPPRETGHRHYQHSWREWGRWMDTFPGLVVYAALLCLAKRPGLWTPATTDDRIVFSEEDLAPPFATATWRALEPLRDPDVERVLALLRDCCRPGWTAAGSLEELLAGAPQASSGAAATTRTTAATGTSARWWETLDPDAAAGPLPPPPPARAAGPCGTRPTSAPSSAPGGRPACSPDPEWFRHTGTVSAIGKQGDEARTESFRRLTRILVGVGVAWLVVIALVWAVLAA